MPTTATKTSPRSSTTEVHDNSLGLVYYNYRHYNPKDGRWLGRDNEKYVTNLYSFLDNHPPSRYDQKGLKYFEYASDITWDDFQGEVPEADLRGQRIAETVLMSPVLSINAENIAISIKSLEDNCVCVYATAKHVTWRFRFSEKRSWATEEAKSSWQTLAHERAHINIYLNAYKTSSLPTIEVCAETYDEAVNRALRALRGERDALLKSCWREQHNRNNQFDAETNHGLIEDKENEWEETLYSEVNW